MVNFGAEVLGFFSDDGVFISVVEDDKNEAEAEVEAEAEAEAEDDDPWLLLRLMFLFVGETLINGVKQSGAPCSMDFKAFDSAVGDELKGEVLTSILIRVVMRLDNLFDLAGLPLFFLSGDSAMVSWNDIDTTTTTTTYHLGWKKSMGN